MIRIAILDARIGLAFGMKVIAWSQNLTADQAQLCGARRVLKEELFQSADIVTVHLVLSQRTKGLVGAAELQAMKPSAWLINTARGPIVDESALIEVLRERRIAGAALDVFDIEPLPADHPFRTLDNVVATPHLGFVARQLYEVFYGDTVKNITRWLSERT
jgi:phosphoglycerate dehydrogenase-like enzyme